MAAIVGSSCPNPTRMMTFITSDGEEVWVPVATAMKFRGVRHFFGDDLDRPVPLPEVKSSTLRRIVLFFEKGEMIESIAEALERKRLFELPSKYEALERERLFELPSKYQALEREKVFVLPLKYQALEEERQEFRAEFFGPLTDKTVVELVKAADYLEIKELLDSVMPILRTRFGFGDDKDADFVYTAKAEAIFRERAAI